MGEETLGLRSLGAEAVLGDSAMSVFLARRTVICRGRRDCVEKTEREKEEGKEQEREIGGLSLTSKQSWVEGGPLPRILRSPMATNTSSGWHLLLLYQASYPALVIRIVRVMHLDSSDVPQLRGVGWGSGSQEATATARLHWIYLDINIIRRLTQT